MGKLEDMLCICEDCKMIVGHKHWRRDCPVPKHRGRDPGTLRPWPAFLVFTQTVLLAAWALIIGSYKHGEH